MRSAILLTLAGCAATALAQQSCPAEDTHYYADGDYCDRYSECREGVYSEQQCPDGLLFNDQITNGRYPCEYPTMVDCSGRTKTQPAQSTRNCPNAWGYFSSGDSSECQYFFNCVDGKDHLFTCPEGLAFSSHTYRCEWPDQSPDCDAEEYLGFSCPAPSDPGLGFVPYASPRDCRQFFLCVGTSPRLQVCDIGRVFNPEIGACDEPENSSGCENYYPADELAAIRERKAAAAKAAEDRKQRLEAKKEELAARRG